MHLQQTKRASRATGGPQYYFHVLRASGPLAHLGVKLGAYVGKGYDCEATSFQFLRYPDYTIPAETECCWPGRPHLQN